MLDTSEISVNSLEIKKDSAMDKTRKVKEPVDHVVSFTALGSYLE